MQMQFDIKNWERMEAGEAIEFRSKRPRPVSLSFNSAAKAAIYIQLASEKEPRLLAVVEGRDTVKFAVDGPFSIVNKTDEVDCYLFTRDGGTVHRVALDEEAYTTLHQPRARDENLERIMEKMNRSINLRLAQERAQMERMLENERRKLAVEAPAPVGAQGGSGGAGDQQPAPDPQPEDAGTPDGGTE